MGTRNSGRPRLLGDPEDFVILTNHKTGLCGRVHQGWSVFSRSDVEVGLGQRRRRQLENVAGHELGRNDDREGTRSFRVQQIHGRGFRLYRQLQFGFHALERGDFPVGQ